MGLGRTGNITYSTSSNTGEFWGLGILGSTASSAQYGTAGSTTSN